MIQYLHKIYHENINIQYIITILETEEKFKMVFTDYTTEYSYEIQCYGIFKYYENVFSFHIYSLYYMDNIKGFSKEINLDNQIIKFKLKLYDNIYPIDKTYEEEYKIILNDGKININNIFDSVTYKVIENIIPNDNRDNDLNRHEKFYIKQVLKQMENKKFIKL